jgi:hypothetical protein
MACYRQLLKKEFNLIFYHVKKEGVVSENKAKQKYYNTKTTYEKETKTLEFIFYGITFYNIYNIV